MPLLIYPEESDDEESLSNPTSLVPTFVEATSVEPASVEPTPYPGPPIKKPTKELTPQPDSDALSEHSTPTREGSMEHIAPKDIMRY